MAKTLETILKLNGKVDPSLQRALKQANSKVVKDAQKTSRKVESTFKGMAKKAVAAIGAAFAVRAIVNFGRASIDAAQDEVLAQTKLAEVMRQRMGATQEQTEKILDLASAQQKLGVIGDEVQVAGAQQLSTFLNQTSSLEALIPAMNNLAAQQKGVGATQEDLVNIANLMGKAIQGQTGALRRVGISFSKAEEEVLKYGNESERAAMMAQVITNNVGNMNEEIAKTDFGKYAQAKNILSDMQETLGKQLMPIVGEAAQIFLPFFEKIFNLLQRVIPILGNIFMKLSPIFDLVGNMLVFALEQLAGLIGFLVEVFDWLSKHEEIAILLGIAVGTVVTALIAYKIQQALANAETGIWAVLAGSATLATTGFGAALNFLTGPIGLVILAVGALIAIGYLVVENWEAISKWLEGVWQGISDFFTGIWNGMVDVVKGAINAVIDAINWIIGAYNDTIGEVGAAIGVNIKIQPIAHLAEGLSVNSPMLALIGEAGPETVVPHNNKPRSRALLHEAAAGVGALLGGNMFIYRPEINLPPGADKEDFKQALADDHERWKAEMRRFLEEEGRLAFA